MTILNKLDREMIQIMANVQERLRQDTKTSRAIYPVRRDQTASDRALQQRIREQSIRMGVVAAGARTRQVTRQASAGLGYGVSIVGQDVMQKIAEQATGRTLQAIEEYLQETRRLVNRRIGLENMHERVALEAKKAIIASYDGQVSGAKNQGYRPQSRLTGRMRNALLAMRPEVSRDSINLLDPTYLDQVAAHWRRLNYGTEGGVAQKPRPDFSLRSAQGIHGSITDRTGKRPGFTMPPGFFLDPKNRVVPFSGVRSGAREDRFFLQSDNPGIDEIARQDAKEFNFERSRRLQNRVKPIPESKFLSGKPTRSRGIRGYRFTDAGLRYLANNYPNELLTVAERWFIESQNAIVPVETTVRPS